MRDVNAQNKLPYKLRLLLMDDQGSPTVAQQVAAKVIASRRTLAVLGPVLSPLVVAGERQYSLANLLDVTPCATADGITELGTKSRTTYRAVATDADEGISEARYLSASNPSRIVVVNDGTTYGRAVARSATSALSAPAAVIGRYSISSASRIKTASAAIMNSSATAVVATGYDDSVASFVKALRDDGSTLPIVTDDGARYPNFFAVAGSTATSVVATSPYVDPSATAAGRAFARRFSSHFGDAPMSCTVEAYDTTRALGVALTHVGTAPTRKAVVHAFGKVDYRGISKRIQFRADHELVKPRVFRYSADNGAFVQTSP
jgi:branched-chain amino acid transport system substrate-binding protein